MSRIMINHLFAFSHTTRAPIHSNKYIHRSYPPLCSSFSIVVIPLFITFFTYSFHFWIRGTCVPPQTPKVPVWDFVGCFFSHVCKK